MKEPWEMTEDEFSIRLFKHISGVEICEDTNFIDMCMKWHDFMKKYLDKKEKKIGKKTEYPVNLHAEIIKWALENKKTVPEHVLEEYPEILEQ